ncbi:MAG TPA: hypothetical protein VK325_06860 [Pseudoxanthomonas sp.]|nr:hypothetical protein [Pseudoxanthomonas sp.]
MDRPRFGPIRQQGPLHPRAAGLTTGGSAGIDPEASTCVRS